MLSEEILKHVKKVDKIDTPRTTIEFLLVASQVKPGDVIDYIKKKETQEAIKEIIDDTPNINWFADVKKMPLNVYYYNINLVSDDFIDKIKNAEENLSILEGLLFGFPYCCILSNEGGKTIKERMIATEHYWCSENCKRSIKLQKLYINVVEKNFPKYGKLIRENSLMDLEIYPEFDKRFSDDNRGYTQGNFLKDFNRTYDEMLKELERLRKIIKKL
ncbi:MAG: hypothetical protein ACTSQP_05430 [Promethearchaeota archaeon]